MTRACLTCLRLVIPHQGACPHCGGLFASRATPAPQPTLHKGMAAFLESVNDNRMHVVGEDGQIGTMTVDEYQALDDDDPRLDRIFTLLSAALRLRNRMLGIDGPARAAN